jgi:hypothetical protein
MAVFSSCEETDQLVINDTPITATKEAGTYPLAVTCNGKWTAIVEDATNHEWCTLTDASGTSNGILTINVTENTDIAARSATVIITSGDLTKSVIINQVDAGGVFYIVGYNVCGLRVDGETAKAYIHVLISEDLSDTLATNNLPDNLFTFSSDIMHHIYNINGFLLFPQEYRFTYKVKMTYRLMTEDDTLHICGYPATYHPLYFFEPTYIIINQISKIQ